MKKELVNLLEAKVKIVAGPFGTPLGAQNGIESIPGSWAWKENFFIVPHLGKDNSVGYFVVAIVVEMEDAA